MAPDEHGEGYVEGNSEYAYWVIQRSPVISPGTPDQADIPPREPLQVPENPCRYQIRAASGTSGKALKAV